MKCCGDDVIQRGPPGSIENKRKLKPLTLDMRCVKSCVCLEGCSESCSGQRPRPCLVVARSPVDSTNNTLHFLKSNVDARLKFQCVAAADELVFVCFSDVAWPVRHDGGSQGSYSMAACHT